jgi:hypothetical protein
MGRRTATLNHLRRRQAGRPMTGVGRGTDWRLRAVEMPKQTLPPPTSRQSAPTRATIATTSDVKPTSLSGHRMLPCLFQMVCRPRGRCGSFAPRPSLRRADGSPTEQNADRAKRSLAHQRSQVRARSVFRVNHDANVRNIGGDAACHCAISHLIRRCVGGSRIKR